MSLLDQDNLVQATIDANTLAARLWFNDVSLLARTGHQVAQDIVDLNGTPQGQKTLWSLITHINHAISSCAFELQADDKASNAALKAIAAEHSQARWVIEQHLIQMPLVEVNPSLDAQVLDRATKRLGRWFSI